MEAMIMANGFVMAKSGWLNQYTNAVGIRNATNLIAAAKQSGDTGQNDPLTSAGSLGSALMTELNKIRDIQYREQLAYSKKHERAITVVSSTPVVE
jgi:hypothetical protein